MDASNLMEMLSGQEVVVNKFSERSANKFREDVLRLARMDPSKPIVIYIDSYGGSVEALASMVGTMNSVPNQFITVAIGKAMSCGAMLLSMGTYRFCEKNARVMIHEALVALPYHNIHNANNHMEEMTRLNTHWMDLTAKRCGLKGYEELRDKILATGKTELFFSAAQAKDFGIVDVIGTPVLVPVSFWTIENSDPKNPIKDNTFMHAKQEKDQKDQAQDAASVVDLQTMLSILGDKKVKKINKKKVIKKKKASTNKATKHEIIKNKVRK